MASKRNYDIVVFGATGFTGALTAEYLARHAPSSIRWALAGRSLDKLEAVRARLVEIDKACASLDLLKADVADTDSIRKVADATRVVIATVGPYILYGEPLVAACAAAGTDYVDLTGEPEFVDLMWLRYHEQAQKSGARLVHCCGFDSIPHDLGALFTVQQLPQGAPIKLEGFVRAGGTFSGGTFHSAVNAFGRARQYAAVRKERFKREGASGGRKVSGTAAKIRFDKALGTWVVPMPTIDPQIVKRSARALSAYGPDFSYGHFVQVKTLSRVLGLVGGVGALFGLAQTRLTRNWLLSKKSSGEGPSEARRRKSWFRVRFVGEAGSKRLMTEVTGGDPGYGETSKMLAESALCLALDPLPKTSGQVTTAAAMGNALIERLQKAGIQFRVVESG
jgi:short subunit dehydrogenase-like uncharacterized protein